MLTLKTVSCLETVMRQFFFCLGRGLQFVVLVVIATVIKKSDSVITLFETMQTDNLLSVLFINFVFSSSFNLIFTILTSLLGTSVVVVVVVGL